MMPYRRSGSKEVKNIGFMEMVDGYGAVQHAYVDIGTADKGTVGCLLWLQ